MRKRSPIHLADDIAKITVWPEYVKWTVETILIGGSFATSPGLLIAIVVRVYLKIEPLLAGPLLFGSLCSVALGFALLALKIQLDKYFFNAWLAQYKLESVQRHNKMLRAKYLKFRRENPDYEPYRAFVESILHI